MTRREELAKYNNERLYVEGVLIDINQPNQKNHHKYGLVFGSVNLPNEEIEIDHVVIAVPESFMNKHDLSLYNKYGFTAKVGTYYKRKVILNTPANVRAYHLTDINARRFTELTKNKPDDLSRHLKNRIASLQKRGLPIDIGELNRILRSKNEGEREQYLNNITKTMSKSDISHADILNTIY